MSPALEPLERGPPRILIVDDEEDILESLKDLLEASMEAEVFTAASGTKGLEVLNEHTVDLIISDYKMPGMDGLEFLSEAADLAPQAPRLMVTAFPDLELAMKAINETRITNFFTKPLDPEETIRVIQETMKRTRAQGKREQSFSRAMDLLRRQKGGDSDE